MIAAIGPFVKQDRSAVDVVVATRRPIVATPTAGVARLRRL